MVFWDADTWMFPALLAQHPALGRVMADYRSDTLPAARRNAINNGYAGALYPWTSGLTGDMGDECYGSVTNDQGKVTSDPNKSCTQQLHLQSDVAFAQWRYYEATGDKEWLAQKDGQCSKPSRSSGYPKPNPPRADTRLTLCRRPMNTRQIPTTMPTRTPPHR